MLVDMKSGLSHRRVFERDAMTTDPMRRGMATKLNCAVSIWNETTRQKDRMRIDRNHACPLCHRNRQTYMWIPTRLSSRSILQGGRRRNRVWGIHHGEAALDGGVSPLKRAINLQKRVRGSEKCGVGPTESGKKMERGSQKIRTTAIAPVISRRVRVECIPRD